MPKKAVRFLADESLEYRIVKHLRKLEYDITTIAEISPSISDFEVLSKAVSENRIILTNDKDFGDLVFLNFLPHKGVILFRLRSERVEDKIKALNYVLKNYKRQIKNNFIVVEDDNVRIRM